MKREQSMPLGLAAHSLRSSDANDVVKVGKSRTIAAEPYSFGPQAGNPCRHPPILHFSPTCTLLCWSRLLNPARAGRYRYWGGERTKQGPPQKGSLLPLFIPTTPVGDKEVCHENCNETAAGVHAHACRTGLLLMVPARMPNVQDNSPRLQHLASAYGYGSKRNATCHAGRYVAGRHLGSATGNTTVIPPRCPLRKRRRGLSYCRATSIVAANSAAARIEPARQKQTQTVGRGPYAVTYGVNDAVSARHSHGQPRRQRVAATDGVNDILNARRDQSVRHVG